MEKKTKQLIKEVKAELKKWEKLKKEATQINDLYQVQMMQYQIDFCNSCLKELENIYKKKENAND